MTTKCEGLNGQNLWLLVTMVETKQSILLYERCIFNLMLPLQVEVEIEIDIEVGMSVVICQYLNGFLFSIHGCCLVR
jgi:hypothetical protein